MKNMRVEMQADQVSVFKSSKINFISILGYTTRSVSHVNSKKRTGTSFFSLYLLYSSWLWGALEALHTLNLDRCSRLSTFSSVLDPTEETKSKTISVKSVWDSRHSLQSKNRRWGSESQEPVQTIEFVFFINHMIYDRK